MPAKLVPSGNLELAVEIPPAVGQRQEAAIRSGDGAKHQILDSVALSIGDPQHQMLDNLPVNFDVPGAASPVKIPTPFTSSLLRSPEIG